MNEHLQKQRTYALIGHGGTGKTSVGEMLLFRQGVIDRLGKVDDGTTLLDFEPEEIKRTGSIQPSVASYIFEKNRHFLLDIPGDANFLGDLEYMLNAVDGSVFVIDAVDGVKPLSKKIWTSCKKHNLPSLIFINKMDRERADFEAALASIENIFAVRPVILTLPIGAKDSFRGYIDILTKKAWFFNEDGSVNENEIPTEMKNKVETLRETAIENIAESDEELIEKYLEEGELSPEDVGIGLRKGTLSGTLVPVCVGSALKNQGGEFLLRTISDLLPSPLERPDFQLSDGNKISPTKNTAFSGFVFKTLTDPFSGQLSLFRVVSGTAQSEMQVINPNQDNKEKFGQLLLLEGKKQSPCKEEMGAGALLGVAKLKNTKTGDTLCDEKEPKQIALPKLPPTILSYALDAEERGEEDKVFAAVNKLQEEDICLNLSRNEDTGDILLSGMGQLHIETTVEKARRRYKIGIALKTPKIPYRETIKGHAEVQGRHKKQSGGRGQFGDCWIRIAPNARGAGYEFNNQIVGGVIPKQYIPAVDKGIQEAAERGILAGYPVVDFKVELYDGSYHNVDSSEMAFKIAGSLAFKKAVESACPVLLEPIMHISIFTPDEFMGDIIGDISSRRGRISGSNSQCGITEIQAQVPMSEILKYAPDLRSMTGGQGTFTMEFDHYEECPAQISEKVIEESKVE